MEKQEAKKRIEKLKKLINRNRYLYHVLDKQEISDEAFDSLKHELLKLETEYPEFVTPDSPTQRVGGKPLDKFKKVEHSSPMLSIEDIFSEDELGDWENYLKTKLLQSKSEGGKEREALFDQGDEDKSSSSSSLSRNESSLLEYFVEPKIDGFAITLIYENGVFSTGATRGSGLIGEDVSMNLKTISSIPLKLEIREKFPNDRIEKRVKELIDKGIIEIRGEVYMQKADFADFNKRMVKKGEAPYANPRNLAAGSIRQLNPKLAASRPLKFLGYDIVSDMGQTKHSEEHQILASLGFKSATGKVYSRLSDILDFWKNIARKRANLPFQIDGVVISVNDNAIFRKLGVAGKSPRGIRAFKFSPKQNTTKILDVKFQVGRTGAITPVAVLSPVQIEGVTITRATLHNEEEIKRLGVKIGDTVIVERAGDVIPAVSRVISDLRTGKEKGIIFPRVCPGCKTKLKKDVSEAIWRCPNVNCPSRKRENLYHFVSRKAFDVEGLGPRIINQLADRGLISNPADIFKLKEGDLMLLEGFAEKSAKNLVEAIQKSKEIPLARFIFSLGIRHIGEETAHDLANHFADIDDLRKSGKEELERISGIGGKVSESVYKWFQLKTNTQLLDNLQKIGIKILPPRKMENKLKGKTFVLTGSLENITRSEAERKIRLLGGEISSSVSRQTDYLVLGEKPGLKLKKAEKLGVKVIGEKEFLSLLG